MTEIRETVLLIVAVFGHSILCFYWGYRFKQWEEDNAKINFDNMPYEKIVDTGEHVVISGGYYSPDPDYKDDESIYRGYHTYDSFGCRMEHIMEFDDDGKVVREDNG